MRHRLSYVRDRLRESWINHLWLDGAIALVLVGIHLVVVAWLQVGDILGDAAPTDRRGVYSSAAVVVSLLASFSGIAIGQLGSAKGSRAVALKSQVAKDLASNWSSIFRAGLVAAVVAVAALLLDPSSQTTSSVPVVARWAFELALVTSVVKFLRASALFRDVMQITALDAGEKEETAKLPAPEIGRQWKRRA
jgi:hypothetical protein